MSPIFPIAQVDPRFRLYTAAAGQVEFAVPFPWQSNVDIVIWRFDLAGDQFVLNEGEHYQLVGAGTPGGGTLTLTEGYEALEGEQFLILGDVQLTRAGSIVQGGRFRSRSTDDDLDRVILIAQEIYRELGRTLRTAYGVSGAAVEPGDAGSVPLWTDLGGLGPGGPSASDIAGAQQQAELAVAAADTATEQAGIATAAKVDAVSSATTATTQAGLATSAATDATAAAATATTQAGLATTAKADAEAAAADAITQAGLAATSEANAAASATAATTAETDAETAASTATTQAGLAASAKTDAEAAAASAAATLADAAQKSANLSDLANVLTARENLKIVVLSQAAYDALASPDADTIYIRTAT